MTEEQRKQLALMCASINKDVDKNRAEEYHEKMSAQLHAFIRQQSIDPEELPYYKVQKVVRDCDSMTIITDTGRYVHVSAEPGYHDSVDFSVGGHPDIEDAHDMGILSKEQYDEYKKAQQAYLGQCREINARTRLTNFVREIGAASVQEYLDELKQ